MNRDCDTFCWQEDHFDNAIVSLCLIFLVTLSTLLYKYIHSLQIMNRNIFILPLYSYIKVIFQLVLSVLSITLKTRFPFIFNIVFSVLMIGNLLISWKLLIYNYKRIQLMQVFAVCGVVWSVLLTTVFDLITEGEIVFLEKIIFFIFQTAGWWIILTIFLFLFKK